MPDGKKRPRKRSRKSKSGSNNPQEDNDADGDLKGGEATIIGTGSEIAIPSSTNETQKVDPISDGGPSTSTSTSNQSTNQPVQSLSKSYPRPQNPTPTAAKPQPPRPPSNANPISKPQNQPTRPNVSFHERTNAHKPSVIPDFDAENPAKRNYTLSVALPGSIIRNAQTPELQSRLAGHIGRTCAIFNVDEIVVFDDGEGEQDFNQDQFESGGMGGGEEPGEDQHQGGRRGGGPSNFDPGAFLARVLQYLETPQYLRKALFPMHRDLRLAGLLPPLDCPHHLRFQDQSPYREGVTVEPPHWAKSSGGGGKRKHGQNSNTASVWVNIGLKDPIEAEVRGVEHVPLGTRVTVKIPDYGHKGRLVSPREPVETKGIYWGYSVRLCPSLSSVLVDSPWKSTSVKGEEEEALNYDLVIGTSERGTSLTEIISSTASQHLESSSSKSKKQSNSNGSQSSVEPLPRFKHALMVFGGLSGLEIAVEKDPGIQLNADDAHQLFDSWINVVEGQGSRTIRTEEALMIALARLKSTLEVLGQ